jgi:hypothetical protein
VPLSLRVRVGSENLALGATVEASSVLGANAASNAVDGDRSTRWISATGDPRPTLTLDLGGPSKLRSLDLYSGVSGSGAFRVRGFTVEAQVGETWVTVGEVTGNGDSPVHVDLSDAPREERPRHEAGQSGRQRRPPAVAAEPLLARHRKARGVPHPVDRLPERPADPRRRRNRMILSDP